MDWSAAVDIYCERTGPAFWAEPLNAVSNLSFILASLWGAYEARRRGLNSPAVWLLVVLAFCIGVGSFLFHTFATVWSGFADTVPIWTFVAAYILIAATLVGGARPGRLALFVVGAVAVVIVLTIANDAPPQAPEVLPRRNPFNGSEQYLPAVIAMLIFTALTQWRAHPIRWWFTAATVIFMVSLSLRTYDIALCAMWPYGTHVFWHLLNGAMIALLLQGLIRNTQRNTIP